MGHLTARWFVPIELAITCIIFVSDHQILNKLLSVLGSGLKTNTRASSENVNKTQDCDIWNFKTENFIKFIQFYSSKLYAYG